VRCTLYGSPKTWHFKDPAKHRDKKWAAFEDVCVGLRPENAAKRRPLSKIFPLPPTRRGRGPSRSAFDQFKITPKDRKASYKLECVTQCLQPFFSRHQNRFLSRSLPPTAELQRDAERVAFRKESCLNFQRNVKRWNLTPSLVHVSIEMMQRAAGEIARGPASVVHHRSVVLWKLGSTTSLRRPYASGGKPGSGTKAKRL